MTTATKMAVWVLAFASLFLAACQPTDDYATEADVPAETTAFTTTTEQPALNPIVTAPAPTVADVGDGDGEGSRNDTGDIVRATVAIPFEAAISGGRRITVTFDGGGPGDFDSPCNWDHRIDVRETDADVEIAVTAIRILSPGGHPRECEPATQWAITTTLATPLGSRPLIDGVTRRTHRAIQIETRLKPTWLPAGWSTELDDETLPQQNSVYTEAIDGGGAQMQLLTSPISLEPRLSNLRTGLGEPIDIRRPDDGVFIVDEARRTILGFEEQGWYYQIISSPEVDPADVIAFARSFERPALVVDGSLPQGLTTSLRTLPLQPGQDEGEARPIQGVLPAG